MPPPSPLTIATSSLQRLVKEEASYHKELESQEARLEKLLQSTEEDENREYLLNQQRTAIAETRNVFPPLLQRIEDAQHKLDDQLAAAGDNATEQETVKAMEVLEKSKALTK